MILLLLFFTSCQPQEDAAEFYATKMYKLCKKMTEDMHDGTLKRDLCDTAQEAFEQKFQTEISNAIKTYNDVRLSDLDRHFSKIEALESEMDSRLRNWLTEIRGKRLYLPANVEEALKKHWPARWMGKLLHGDAQYVLSEKIPKKQGDVKKIVFNNWKEMITDNTSKDRFIKVYAPWCGHCKKLAPTWKKFAKILAKHGGSAVIGKFDSSSNDYPEGLQVNGVPMLLFYPAGESEPFLYEGPRELVYLLTFLAEKAATGETIDAAQNALDALGEIPKEKAAKEEL